MLTELWHPASGHFAAQRPVQRPVLHPVAAADVYVAEPLDRSVWSLSTNVWSNVRSPL